MGERMEREWSEQRESMQGLQHAHSPLDSIHCCLK